MIGSLVLLHWLYHESIGGPGWETIQEQKEWAEEPVPVVKTVGWIIYETDQYLVIIDTVMSDHSLVGTAHKIIKSNIILRKELSDG